MGPYLLGGWSFGGIVAYEMAQQLTSAGQAVELMALVDSWPPSLIPPLPQGDAEIRGWFLRDLMGGRDAQAERPKKRRAGEPVSHLRPRQRQKSWAESDWMS